MAKSNVTEIEFQLRKLVAKYSDLFVYHQWASEHDRWVELVFALVTRVSDKPEPDVRAAIEELDDQGLLDVEELSEIPKKGSGIDYKSQPARHLIESLSEPGQTEEGQKRPGFKAEEAKRVVLVMHEAAKSLTEHHDAKIQKYLRKYGQQMIDELSESFSFSRLNKKEVQYAFTYWLQNVLNMPLMLKTKSMDAFCQKLAANSNKLIEEADRLDINLALLDDMIDQSTAASSGPKEVRGK
jgi:hypothetical protein